MLCRAALLFLTLGAACAQSIQNYSLTEKGATLGTTQCIFWMQGSSPGAEIAVYQSGVLVSSSIQHFPAPANGTAIFPCPAPLDRFQVSVSAAGIITASIVPIVVPPPAYTDVVVTLLSDGVKNTIPLPSAPMVAPSVQVSVGGLLQTPVSKWNLNGAQINLMFTPAAGLEMVVMYR